jgi:hypothetical protein
MKDEWNEIKSLALHELIGFIKSCASLTPNDHKIISCLPALNAYLKLFGSVTISPPPKHSNKSEVNDVEPTAL